MQLTPIQELFAPQVVWLMSNGTRGLGSSQSLKQMDYDITPFSSLFVKELSFPN